MDGKVFLQSYDSVVACKDGGKEGGIPILYKDWDYSRTTMKYVGKFLSDVFNKHITKKDIYKMKKADLECEPGAAFLVLKKWHNNCRD